MSETQQRRATDVQSMPLSIRQVVVARAWADLKRFSTIFFFLTTVLTGYNSLRLRYFDVRYYSASDGVIAPLTVVEDAEGKPVEGHLETVFHAADRVGWDASFCADAGAAYTAHVSLVHVEDHGAQDTAVVSRISHFSGDAHRCGHLFAFLSLPADAAPGSYKIHRYGVFRDGSWWPLRFDFPDIPFTVVASGSVSATGTAGNPDGL